MIVHPLATGFGLSFLIEYPHGLYLIDSGSPRQEGKVLSKMKALGRSDLKLIWITHAHYDHYGSAAALRELTGAPVAVHPADARYLEAGLSPLGTPRGRGALLRPAQVLLNRLQPLPPTAPDHLVEEGEGLRRWGWDAAVLHTPGHTPGHTCVLLPEGIAFAADLIGRNPRPKLQDLLGTDWEHMGTSLHKLQTARPEWIYTGHSVRPLPGEALQRIRAKKHVDV